MSNTEDDGIDPTTPASLSQGNDSAETTMFGQLPRHRKLSPAKIPVATSQPGGDHEPVQLDAFATVGEVARAAPGRLEVIPSGISGVVLIDPFAIEPEPFNGRGLAAFDPDRNRELIDDMRVRGNTVAVRLRPRPDDQGWTCPSGSRRVNAARVIAADQPGFRVAAIIDQNMTDIEAYALCIADNQGRNEVTPLQRGREMQWAIEHLHGGDRKAYVDHNKIDKSVVSRALELIGLPEAVLAAAEDRETLPTLFAEKLAPKLKDKVERSTILARAKALRGERLAPPRLMHYLLTGERDAPAQDRRVAWFGSGRGRVRASVTVAPNRSALFKLPATQEFTSEQKQELRRFLREQIEELFNITDIAQT